MFLALCSTAGALSLPPGFQARTLPLAAATPPNWNNGLLKPTTLDFAPDGKLFVADRNGFVHEFDSIEDSTATLVLSIPDKVMARGDRGILGMKLDPEYPSKPYIYLSYTYDAPIGGDSANSTHTHLADGEDGCDEVTNNAVDCLVSGRLARVKINPATSVAVGGPVDPTSEEVLINSWCQQTTSHSIGDIEFDSEGALLMSGGDGASWGTADYGQLGNPCGDPPYEGGSLRAQDLKTPATSGDPTNYNGSIIRVNRETGAAMPNNPLAKNPLFAEGHEDVAARRILSQGNRNPYRFTIQPGTSNLYVGDVGQDHWEEIDRLTLPPTGNGVTNFGWPCYEGGTGGNLAMPNWQAAEQEQSKPFCAFLYNNPSKVTAPFFAYAHVQLSGHDAHLFPGDACDPEPGAAIAGLAFYDPSGVATEDLFPPEYRGALFFSDAARGCIWTMEEGVGGAPVPSTVANFAVREGGELFNAVDIVQGPNGAFYLPNFYADSVIEIRYFPGNQAPTAKLTADKTYGAIPLKVDFDASGSTDPDLGDGDELHYSWDLNGDGTFGDATTPTVSHEYTAATNVTVKVRISDNFSHTSVASVNLYPGDKGPPQVTIQKPSSTLEWAVGETVDYEATATDPDGQTFASGLTPHWEFRLEHCPSACHEHPITSADAASGSFVAPAHEFPSHLKLIFTATDSRGMTDSEEVEIYPRLVEVGVSSDPAGIPLGLEGVTSTEPAKVTMMAGAHTAVSAPEKANVDGQEYEFSSWSDGLARVHEVTSLVDVDLVAHFVPAKPHEEQPPSTGGDAGNSTPSPVPIGPPAPAPAHLRLTSKPPGVTLRLGAVRSAAPFAAELAVGTSTSLTAPPTIRRHGRTLRFRQWLANGRSLGTSPRRGVKIGGDARYTAVYAAAKRRSAGSR
ncbi:MAG TPA: PQQ-dependent sugar dehydrogenase [Solirubrobacterales bacterium]|nr:PQQ-dependent sugar dehydrogenase [Solirubrobacterales bacterium]